ncbi:hypothetical protein G6F35_015202 [Rhizopus arrhizus]|nr:hypothetical protein G6F35_015202 [Rhizopus arrhizus]
MDVPGDGGVLLLLQRGDAAVRIDHPHPPRQRQPSLRADPGLGIARFHRHRHPVQPEPDHRAVLGVLPRDRGRPCQCGGPGWRAVARRDQRGGWPAGCTGADPDGVDRHRRRRTGGVLLAASGHDGRALHFPAGAAAALDMGLDRAGGCADRDRQQWHRLPGQAVRHRTGADQRGTDAERDRAFPAVPRVVRGGAGTGLRGTAVPPPAWL